MKTNVSVACQHVECGLAPAGSACTFCKASKIVNVLFEAQPQYSALLTRLLSQIDDGRYTFNSFRRTDATREGIEALFAIGRIPDNAWVDSLKLPRQTRETFRGELVASGYFNEPINNRVYARTKSVTGRCAHSTRPCALCCAQRRIEQSFRPYEHLYALRDQFAQQLARGAYEPEFFRLESRRFWGAVESFGQSPDSVNHTWLDTRSSSFLVVAKVMREELVACGLLESRDDLDPCRHREISIQSSQEACTFCSARRSVLRIFAGRPDLASFQERLLLQVDRGRYNRRLFGERYQLGRGLRELCADLEPLTHDRVDRLSVRVCDRESLREELIAAGLLVKQPDAVVRRNRRPRRSGIACEHQAVSCCARCRAERYINQAFHDLPALHPLRDRYVDQLRCGFYAPTYFAQTETPLWRYIEDLGKLEAAQSRAWLDAQRQTGVLRCLDRELVACGLLEPRRDHPAVGRFAVWAERFITNADLTDDERRIVRQFQKLRMMRYARRFLNKRTDNGASVRDALHRTLRLIVRFIAFLRDRKRILQTFDKPDIEAFPRKEQDALRSFFVWLRQSKISSSTWIPKRIAVEPIYDGLGIEELRRIVDRLLNDESVSLQLRVAGIFAYFGLTYTVIAKIRASDILVDDQVLVGGKGYDLEPTVAGLVRRVRDDLVARVRATRPVDWDPWLFGSPDAVEQPDPMTLSRALGRAGFPSQALRNVSKRLGSSNATVCFVTQGALGRVPSTAAKHLKAFSSRAASYAAMLATARLDPEDEI